MLGEGEFDKRVSEDGIEVWVTMMGPYLNMNTAFIDRSAGIVAIVDPFDASEWGAALSSEGLSPTHLLYTHTHRDHAAGYPGMIALYPELEVWGHVDARVPGLLGHVVFGEVTKGPPNLLCLSLSPPPPLSLSLCMSVYLPLSLSL